MITNNRLTKFTVLVALAAVAVALPAPAFAKATRVHPGQSIQAALDAASPGDEIRVDPGVYQEQVVIEKDGITLTGAGASEKGTVLVPPAARRQTNCSEGTTFQDGICIVGNPTVDDVTVKGFLIRGFPDGGVTALGTSDLTVKDNWTDANGWGIQSFAAEGERLEHNVVSNSGDLGLWVADSPSADASITHNEAYGNRVGIIAEDASRGKISGNYSHDNGFGIAVTNAGNGASDWKVTDNRVNHNNKAYPKDASFPGSPATSGTGIGIQGATATTVKGNEVLGNQPALPLKGAGIDIHSTAYAGGSDPVNDVIQDNKVHENLQYDLVWDLSGSPTFKHNDCDSSNPPGLCH
jgi:parallel beta-helix repeat protein